jgi:hypothetical protein
MCGKSDQKWVEGGPWKEGVGGGGGGGYPHVFRSQGSSGTQPPEFHSKRGGQASAGLNKTLSHDNEMLV